MLQQVGSSCNCLWWVSKTLLQVASLQQLLALHADGEDATDAAGDAGLLNSESEQSGAEDFNPDDFSEEVGKSSVCLFTGGTLFVSCLARAICCSWHQHVPTLHDRTTHYMKMEQLT